MRRLAFLSLCVLVWASLTFAQVPTLGLYADATGADCNIIDAGPGLLPVYVVVTNTPGVTACQFAAPMPPCMTTTYLSDSQVFGVTIGNSQNGVGIGFGACLAAPLHVLTINYFSSGTTPACCTYPVLPDPAEPSGEILFVDCDLNQVIGMGLTSTVNGNASCPCPTGDNLPPNPPSNPSPPHLAVNQPLNTQLSWTASDPDGDPLVYDVYFGTNAGPPLVSADQSATTYDPGLLQDQVTYYWRIVAKDNQGPPASGPVWQFTTGTVVTENFMVGVFADAGGNVCNIVDDTFGLLNVYCVVLAPEPTTAVTFAAPMPQCFSDGGAVYLADANVFGVTIGNSQTGVSIGFGSCLPEPVHVLTIQFLAQGNTAPCCLYSTIGGDFSTSGFPEFVDCPLDLRIGEGMTNTINGDPSCPCPINGVVNEPPVAECQDVTVIADSSCTADASIDNGSFDPDGDPITLTQSPAGPYPLGTTMVTLTVEDDQGASDTCTGTVTVVDTVPPAITVTLDRDVLWPPNHKMADVYATVTVTDDCCPMPTFRLVEVTSDEPDNGKGDGNTTGDIVIFSDTHVQLRAERSGNDDGRVYTLHYEAEDCDGNTTGATAEVRVPHDLEGGACAVSGFGSPGIGFDPEVEQFALLILSKPPKYEIGWDGSKILVEEGLDATMLDVTKVYVGNLKGIVLPLETLELDNDGDGLVDLVLYYSAREVNILIAASTPTVDDAINLDINFGAIGLHYTSPTGTDYLVPDIFNLGEEVPLATEQGDETAGRPGEDKGEPKENAPGLTTPVLTAYPNPFNPQTTIGYTIAQTGIVRLNVYDIRGRLMRRLVSGSEPAGEHTVVWDGRDDRGSEVSTGVYFVRFEAGGQTQTHKIVFMK
ncbi:MAG: T9SS type A sorting domain-containing protein [Candidatus Latescibacterota bacterium]|nr:MAG: T9SS type A sorting domain-containing protein [Candidatus Latescibacterota bacterium]